MINASHPLMSRAIRTAAKAAELFQRLAQAFLEARMRRIQREVELHLHRHVVR